MNVSFNGYDEKVLTFACTDKLEKGTPVKLSGNGTVAACADDDVFIRVVLSVRDGFAAVQTGGYVQLVPSGSVAIGYQKISAATDGKVKADTDNGREYLVLHTAADNVGIIL